MIFSFLYFGINFVKIWDMCLVLIPIFFLFWCLLKVRHIYVPCEIFVGYWKGLFLDIRFFNSVYVGCVFLQVAESWDTQLLPVPFILDQSDYTPTTNSVVELHTWANIYWKNIVCKAMLVLVLVLLSSSGFTDLCMCLSWSESNSPGFYHFNARGSSCNSLFFGLILSSFLSLSISWNPILPWDVI